MMRWEFLTLRGSRMDSEEPTTLIEHFSIVEDPRDPSKRRHLLIDILIVAITAVLCGADSWTEIEEFGKCHEAWFRKFLKLDNGIPSHDTFGRVFSLLAPTTLQERFGAWVASVRQIDAEEEIIAIDGKSLRRSHDRKRGQGPLHMVTIYLTPINSMLFSSHGLATLSSSVAESSIQVRYAPSAFFPTVTEPLPIRTSHPSGSRHWDCPLRGTDSRPLAAYARPQKFLGALPWPSGPDLLAEAARERWTVCVHRERVATGAIRVHRALAPPNAAGPTSCWFHDRGASIKIHCSTTLEMGCGGGQSAPVVVNQPYAKLTAAAPVLSVHEKALSTSKET
jgi:hypothetical protein